MHNYIKAEISAAAVRANFAVLRDCVGPRVKICAVVKANAYGHGQNLLLELMAELADWLGVATPAEALHLREIGYDGPILVFFAACTDNPQPNLARTLDELIRKRVTLTIASQVELDLLTKATRRTETTAEVHVMVDTGMTRSGLPPDDVPGLMRQIRLAPAIDITGIYTHLACADETDKTSARRQLACFEQVLDTCGIDDGSGILRHAASSAAVLDLPEAHYDMVRPGVAVYGYLPSDQMHNRLPLKPALRLTAHVIQTKTVPAGTRVGYGQTYEFQRESRVGLVPVGYADGYMRSLSGKAIMRIAGQDVPIRGRVSMDQTTVDITDHPTAKVGDEVEIISPDPAAANSVENLARLAGTIPYEIICRLGDRMQRYLVE